MISYLCYYILANTLVLLQEVTGLISITFNAWTSKAGDPYLTVTAHYIHSPGNQPNNWKLHSRVLGYTEIKGSHSGANTAAVVMRVIDRYKLRSKVCIYLHTYAG